MVVIVRMIVIVMMSVFDNDRDFCCNHEIDCGDGRDRENDRYGDSDGELNRPMILKVIVILIMIFMV